MGIEPQGTGDSLRSRRRHSLQTLLEVKPRQLPEFDVQHAPRVAWTLGLRVYLRVYCRGFRGATGYRFSGGASIGQLGQGADVRACAVIPGMSSRREGASSRGSFRGRRPAGRNEAEIRGSGSFPRVHLGQEAPCATAGDHASGPSSRSRPAGRHSLNRCSCGARRFLRAGSGAAQKMTPEDLERPV